MEWHDKVVLHISQKESVLPCVSGATHLLKFTSIPKYPNALELNELEAAALVF